MRILRRLVFTLINVLSGMLVRIKENFPRITLVVLFILFVASPYLTNIIVKSTNFEYESEWVSFFGNYFGGIIGFFGVLLTVRFTTREENENRRLQVIPFIEVTYEPEKDVPAGTPIIIGYEKNSYNQNYYGSLTFQNVGTGPVIDLVVSDMEFREMSKRCDEASVNSPKITKVIRPDGQTVAGVTAGIYVPWLAEVLEEKEPMIRKIKLKLKYKDLLNNVYSQNLTLYFEAFAIYSEEKGRYIHSFNSHMHTSDDDGPVLVGRNVRSK